MIDFFSSPTTLGWGRIRFGGVTRVGAESQCEDPTRLDLVHVGCVICSPTPIRFASMSLPNLAT